MPEGEGAPRLRDYFERPALPMRGAVRVAGGRDADRVRVEWAADAKGGILCNVGFRARACPSIIALSALAAEHLEGAAVEAAAEQFDGWWDGAVAALDIPVEKAGKILIIKDTLHDLLAQARRV